MIKPISRQRLLTRFFCTFLPYFVPSRRGVTTREYWEKYPTAAFGELEPASIALMEEVMTLAPDRDTSILDMGCNAGRHLDFLFRQGYRSLRGVDFSSAAIRDMEQRYPEMFRASKITVASFQDYLTNNPEAVDLVYTRGATFELVHPRFPLVKRVCAIARKHVVMVISEAGHAFPRFWVYEFAREGFELRHLRRPASRLAPEHMVSLLTFERLS